jgi:hypothetical protein
MAIKPSPCSCSERLKIMDLDADGICWIEECTLCTKLWFCERDEMGELVC